MKIKDQAGPASPVSQAGRRPADRPRGYFEIKDPWSTDKTIKYFQGAVNKVIWPLIKLKVVFGFWYVLWLNRLDLFLVIVSTFVLLLTYQHVIAFIFGLKVMPTMDQACFISSSKAHVNICSITKLEGQIT